MMKSEKEEEEEAMLLCLFVEQWQDVVLLDHRLD
jgi:hypothetical protein